MDIIAAVARGPETPFSVETVALDEPREDEILVKVAGVGLCHTDLTARAGQIMPIKLPAVLGHEGSGLVVAVGAKVSKYKAGDRVVMSFRSCGRCRNCTTGHPAYCESMPSLNYVGSRLDGTTAIHSTDLAGPGSGVSSNFFGQSSFAAYALTYERNLVAVSAGVPLELAGPLACGVQTGAGAILNVLRPAEGSSLLVTGGGSVGLSAVLAAVVAGCTRIIVAEPVAKRRELALQLGATHTVDPRNSDLAQEVRRFAPSGVDHFFDSTGLPSVISSGLSALGLRGSAALVGVPPKLDSALTFPLLALVGLGISIHGVVEGDSNPEAFITRLMHLYSEGRFPFDRLISTYPFQDINRAVSDHKEGVCVKAVLIPS
jgi:aryl-alcohol dehydrogenase